MATRPRYRLKPRIPKQPPVETDWVAEIKAISGIDIYEAYRMIAERCPNDRLPDRPSDLITEQERHDARRICHLAAGIVFSRLINAKQYGTEADEAEEMAKMQGFMTAIGHLAGTFGTAELDPAPVPARAGDGRTEG